VEPIFDRSGKTVAWLRNDVVFDRASHRYAAFLQGRHGDLFSYDGRYIGRLHRGYLRDRAGDAVAFLNSARGGPVLPVYSATAVLPVPLAPPVAPGPLPAPAAAAPTLNWSQLSWNQFLAG
jgi:hypothetical protein